MVGKYFGFSSGRTVLDLCWKAYATFVIVSEDCAKMNLQISKCWAEPSYSAGYSKR